jgi:hypothetical protein
MFLLSPGFNWESHKRHPYYHHVADKIPDLQVRSGTCVQGGRHRGVRASSAEHETATASRCQTPPSHTLKLLAPSYLQAAGVSHLWLPPPSQSVSPEGYMPGQLYKLDSCYGSQQQLTELLGKLRDAGIDPLADIVINHRCVCV